MAPQVCAKVSADVYNLLGVNKLATSVYHPSGDGGFESVNATMAHVLAMVGNENQNDLNTSLPLVKFACDYSASTTRACHQRDPY